MPNAGLVKDAQQARPHSFGWAHGVAFDKLSESILSAANGQEALPRMNRCCSTPKVKIAGSYMLGFRRRCAILLVPRSSVFPEVLAPMVIKSITDSLGECIHQNGGQMVDFGNVELCRGPEFRFFPKNRNSVISPRRTTGGR
jgi:hypothetical protein